MKLLFITAVAVILTVIVVTTNATGGVQHKVNIERVGEYNRDVYPVSLEKNEDGTLTMVVYACGSELVFTTTEEGLNTPDFSDFVMEKIKFVCGE